MFTPAYRQGGGAIESHPYYIPATTVVKKGMVVGFTEGVGIVVFDGTNFTTAIWGVAAENHDATTAGRQSGTEIEIWDDADIIFKTIPDTESTVTSGSATAWNDTSVTAANDIFNGGKIVITNTNNVAGFSVGDILNITDFANTGGAFTVTGAGGTIAAGMKGRFFPGKLAVGCIAFDLDSATAADNIDLDTAGGTSVLIKDVVWNGQTKESTVYVKFIKHKLGNALS